MPNESFDAPSDFQSGSGDSGTSIWLWIGIGCGAILLIVAGVLIFGAYKGVSCCQQAMKRQAEARKTSMEFARDLRDENYGAAWKQTSESFRQQTDRESFENQVAKYRPMLEETYPRLVGMQRQLRQRKEGGSFWNLDIGFLPREGDEYLVMKLRLMQRGSGEKVEFRVDAMSFERQERDLATTPPAVRVRRLNRFVSEGSLEKARSLMADSFEPGSSEKAFKSYVGRHEDVLGAGALEFVSVGYRSRSEAVVLARHDTGTGRGTYVRYEVGTASGQPWSITSIEIDVEPPADETPSAAPDAGTPRPDVDSTADVGGQ